MEMPVEQAVQVYNFVRFLRSQPKQVPLVADEDEDWLSDSEEQMQAEDALWEATQDCHRDKFEALVEAARAEIAADATQPMFDEQGNFVSE